MVAKNAWWFPRKSSVFLWQEGEDRGSRIFLSKDPAAEARVSG